MDPLTIAGIAVVVILSITSHEAAHAIVADWCGDPTAREQGRVTLNPIPHIDPVMTLLLPGVLLFSGANFLFGGAKPVPVRVSQLRSPRRDWALVGAAGPAMNVLLALLLAGALAVLHHSGAIDSPDRTSESGATSKILAIGILANVVLAVFNMLPIPPLDGSRVVQRFLPDKLLIGYLQLERYGLFIVIGLIIFFPPLQQFVGESVFWILGAIAQPLGIAPVLFPALAEVFG